MRDTIPDILIIGGGAGGLELATLLGRKLGKCKKANIILVDQNLTHLWKPLWHEVAAGTLNSHEDEINYVAHAYANHFSFQLGRMNGLNRQQKKIFLAPVYNDEQQVVIPERALHYSILVIAVGSVSNDFNTPGVAEYCLFLDSRKQADYLQQVFLKTAIYTHNQMSQEKQTALSFAIVGGGATGVELAAELHYAAQQASHYRLADINPNQDIKITIIEAGKTILANLPEAIIKETTTQLNKYNIEVITSQRVTKVDSQGFYTASNLFIPAEIKIWAAGIKAPDFLNQLDGLETNKINQLIVKPTLQTSRDENIFAFGDCAACPQINKENLVPPRAQAAHQQAKFLVKTITRYIHKKILPEYHYYDYGSLISLSRQTAVGSLMGRALGQFTIYGQLARLAYASLYKFHQIVLFGKWRVFLITLANLLTRPFKPRLKLH